MRCARCLAELVEDATTCRICGERVQRSYRGEPDGPTEVIYFGGGAHWEVAASETSDFRKAEQVITDGRLNVREIAEITGRFAKPPERPSQGSPFAALISEALGLRLQPVSEVVAIPVAQAIVAEDTPLPIEEPPADEPIQAESLLDVDPITGDANRGSGGRSQAEREGWLDAGYERPSSDVLPLRPSASPKADVRASRKSVVPSVAPLGPPPVRVESLPLNDPDRQVRRAAELVLAGLEALSDHKLGAAKNHVKLALGFRDNPAYRGLEDYIVRMEANRDPRLDALEKRAAKLEADGAHDKAEHALQEALAIADEPQLYERLGLLIAVKMGRPEDGLGFLERAARLRPNSKGYAQSLERVQKLVDAAAPPKAKRARAKKSR